MGGRKMNQNTERKINLFIDLKMIKFLIRASKGELTLGQIVVWVCVALRVDVLFDYDEPCVGLRLCSFSKVDFVCFNLKKNKYFIFFEVLKLSSSYPNLDVSSFRCILIGMFEWSNLCLGVPLDLVRFDLDIAAARRVVGLLERADFRLPLEIDLLAEYFYLGTRGSWKNNRWLFRLHPISIPGFLAACAGWCSAHDACSPSSQPTRSRPCARRRRWCSSIASISSWARWTATPRVSVYLIPKRSQHLPNTV